MPAASPSQPIGIFDSGVGGLTVARAVLDRLAGERLLYLGDTARVPYGSRSPGTVIRYSRNAARFLLQRQVKLLLIACNTASAAALEALSDELPVSVIGAVAPGAEAAVAATQSGAIGVIGTLATVRSSAYVREIQRLAPGVRVTSVPCPLFVPLVEEGWIQPGDEVALRAAERYLAELARAAPDMDTLVLGCTHYPLLMPVLEQVVGSLWRHEVRLVDSATAMARVAERELARLGLLSTGPVASGGHRAVDRLTCFVTDEARVGEVGARFLGRSLEHVELVDL